MKRSLSLVLNGRKSNIMLMSETIYLELEKMDSRELDEYISKKFNSSEEIRKRYQSEINQFLQNHSSFLSRVQEETGKKYDGSIVITELQDDLTIERKKVLYKKDIIQFNEIIKNKKFILSLESYDYLCNQSAYRSGEKYRRIFPEYYGKEFKFYCYNEQKFKKIMGQWKTMLKKSSNYYDIIRKVLKEYQNRYKELGLDSLDVVYSNYLNRKKKDNTKSFEKIEYLENLKLEFQEPVRYPKIYDEDGYPGDLEDHSQDRHFRSENYSDDVNYEYFEDESVEETNYSYKLKKN